MTQLQKASLLDFYKICALLEASNDASFKTENELYQAIKLGKVSILKNEDAILGFVTLFDDVKHKQLYISKLTNSREVLEAVVRDYKDYDSISIHVSDHDRPLIELLKKLGFVKTDFCQDFYYKSGHAYKMKRTLNEEKV